MKQKIKSVRPFIGAENFDLSRNFYRDLGFRESVLFPNMSLFSKQETGFYLQDAYVKDWVDNTMVFLEVENVEEYRHELLALELANKYAGVRISAIRHETWGKLCFLHDPSGILWQLGEFL